MLRAKGPGVVYAGGGGSPIPFTRRQRAICDEAFLIKTGHVRLIYRSARAACIAVHRDAAGTLRRSCVVIWKMRCETSHERHWQCVRHGRHGSTAECRLPRPVAAIASTATGSAAAEEQRMCFLEIRSDRGGIAKADGFTARCTAGGGRDSEGVVGYTDLVLLTRPRPNKIAMMRHWGAL